MNDKRELELYIHIPFCIRKCKYCDFLSAPSNEKERQLYVESLCRKIRSYEELAKAYTVVTIFLGGGTPSVLTGRQMKEIFAAITDTFSVKADAEISMEMNPGTVTADKLLAYKSCGINRLSIGLQSTDDEELLMLGRIHTYDEFLKSYQMARDAGFSNINVDLMSAIPGQTRESYEKTLRKVAELIPPPEHISAYSLIIEEGTPFYEIYGEKSDVSEESDCRCENGENSSVEYIVREKEDESRVMVPMCQKAKLPSEEEERQMYQDTVRILEEYGYHRYEISNYAKEGYECRHNLGYWNRREYLGIGSGAASLIDNCRFTAPYLPENERESDENVEILSREAQMEETMFLGLRTMKGVSAHRFKDIFGVTLKEIYGTIIEKLVAQGLLEWNEEKKELASDLYLRLTERGIDVSNYVMSEFLF